MKLEKTSPLFPTPYTIDHVAAFQALERGEADSVQQKNLLAFLVNDLCAAYDTSYRPGEDGRRDSDFAEGKRHVGLSIIKLLKINIKAMKESKND